MLAHQIILTVFAALISQGNLVSGCLVSALPLNQPQGVNARDTLDAREIGNMIDARTTSPEPAGSRLAIRMDAAAARAGYAALGITAGVATIQGSNWIFGTPSAKEMAKFTKATVLAGASDVKKLAAHYFGIIRNNPATLRIFPTVTDVGVALEQLAPRRAVSPDSVILIQGIERDDWALPGLVQEPLAAHHG